MIPEMIQLILTLICIIAIGSGLYFFRYMGKEKPKVGVKRERFSEYLKDYVELKLYWGSICFIIFGVTCLVAIGIIELAFS